MKLGPFCIRSVGARAGSTLRNKEELCHAVKKEDVNDVRDLLFLASDLDVNTPDEDGDTPLILACAQACTIIVEMLLSHRGTDVNAQNMKGETALMKASTCSRYKYCIVEGFGTRPRLRDADISQYSVIVKLLLARPDIDVNLQNKRGEIALIKASFPGLDSAPIVKLLLAHPAINVNLQENGMGYSALMKSVFCKSTEIVRILLSHAETDINVRGQHGYTALIHAAGGHRVEVTKMLLNHPDVELNLQNDNGDTALIQAIYRTDLVDVLLAHPGIDVNVQDGNGRTALMKFSEQGDINSVKALLKHPDIDINLTDKNGKSVLDSTVVNIYTQAILREYVSQLESPNEEPVKMLPSPTVPVLPGAQLPTSALWPQPSLPPPISALTTLPPHVMLQAPEYDPPGGLHIVMTEAERSALVEEMVNMFERQENIFINDVDEMSDIGDTTIRDADTVVHKIENGLEALLENERLRAENFLLRNNFPSATLLNPAAEYAHNDNDNNNMQDGDEESVQTNLLFPTLSLN